MTVCDLCKQLFDGLAGICHDCRDELDWQEDREGDPLESGFCHDEYVCDDGDKSYER